MNGLGAETRRNSSEMHGISTATKPESESFLMDSGFCSRQAIKAQLMLSAVFLAQLSDGLIKSQMEVPFEMVLSPKCAREFRWILMNAEPLFDGLSRLSHIQGFGQQSLMMGESRVVVAHDPPRPGCRVHMKCVDPAVAFF